MIPYISFIRQFAILWQQTGFNEYQQTTLKQVAEYVYENISNYQLLDNIEYVLEHVHDLSRLIEYSNNNLRYEGIMINPQTKDPFSFEGWILQGMIFKGMGVTSFRAINVETGEVELEL